MKTIFTPAALALAAFLMVSCEAKKTPEEIAKENISAYIKKDMNDPDSFEFVEMTDFDTLTTQGHYDIEINIKKILLSKKDRLLQTDKENVELAKENLELSKSLESADISLYEQDFNEANEDYEKNKKMFEGYEKDIDSLLALKENTSPSKIEYIRTSAKIRGNNSFGAKILTTYRIRLDEDMNVLLAKPNKK